MLGHMISSWPLEVLKNKVSNTVSLAASLSKSSEHSELHWGAFPWLPVFHEYCHREKSYWTVLLWEGTVASGFLLDPALCISSLGSSALSGCNKLQPQAQWLSMSSLCISSELWRLSIDIETHTIKNGTRSEHDLRDGQIMWVDVVTNIAKILKGDEVAFNIYGI